MPCPRTQQANLPACSPQLPLNAERQSGKLRMPFFKVFWYDSTRGMNPRSTDCEADALTTTPSRRYSQKKEILVWFVNCTREKRLTTLAKRLAKQSQNFVECKRAFSSTFFTTAPKTYLVWRSIPPNSHCAGTTRPL